MKDYFYDEKKIQEWLKKGCSNKTGKDYVSWIKVYRFSSSGRSTRIKGWKTDRVHHLLSDLERNYFLILDWDDDVFDIREQYPIINIEETIKIAKELRVRHPSNHNECFVVTTDFFITIKKDNDYINIARSTKYSDSFKKERVMQKFEIERRYYSARGIDWGIVSIEKYNKTFVENLRNIHPFYWFNDNESECNHENASRLYFFLEEISDKENWFISEAALYFDEFMKFLPGTGLNLLKYLIAHKYIKLDMERKLEFNKIELTEILFDRG